MSQSATAPQIHLCPTCLRTRGWCLHSIPSPAREAVQVRIEALRGSR